MKQCELRCYYGAAAKNCVILLRLFLKNETLIAFCFSHSFALSRSFSPKISVERVASQKCTAYTYKNTYSQIDMTSTKQNIAIHPDIFSLNYGWMIKIWIDLWLFVLIRTVRSMLARIRLILFCLAARNNIINGVEGLNCSHRNRIPETFRAVEIVICIGK